MFLYKIHIVCCFSILSIRILSLCLVFFGLCAQPLVLTFHEDGKPWARILLHFLQYCPLGQLQAKLYSIRSFVLQKNTQRNGITPHTNITFLFSSVDDKFEKKMLWFESSEILKCYRRVTSDVLYFAWAFDFGFLIRLALSDSLVDLFV